MRVYDSVLTARGVFFKHMPHIYFDLSSLGRLRECCCG